MIHQYIDYYLNGAIPGRPKSKPAKKPDSSVQKQPVIDDNSKPEPTPSVEEGKPQKAVKSHQSYDPNAAERARRWRENNPDRHKEYMRDYMRRRRNQ